MYRLSILRVFFFAFLFVSINAANARPEGVGLDPKTGDYIVTYLGEDQEGDAVTRQVIFAPATKIEPVVYSMFALDPGYVMKYSYRVKNGARSKQNLELIIFNATNITGELTAPAGWNSTMVPNFNGFGLQLGWSYDSEDPTAGLRPGDEQKGFAFTSPDLPGIGIMRLSGATPLQGFPDHGPTDQKIYEQVLRITDPATNSVGRLVVTPTIPVLIPFNATNILSSLAEHISHDLIQMKLIDPVLASQLDRLFTAAIAAAKIDNTTAVKSNLKNIRHLLKKEHKDVESEDHEDDPKADKPRLIDKLAARVLDFDVKYVLRRLEKAAED